MEDSPENRVPSEPVTRKVLEDYLKIQDAAKLTPEEEERFCALAVRFQLNPFLREIHLIVNEEKGARRTVAVVGYEVYLRKAERTGKLDGWKTWTVGDGDNLKAVIEIYRHDWSHPFQHEVHLGEAIQKLPDGKPTSFWERMPKFQLRKVCISQGFRLCFPEELGGIPYEPAELSQAESPKSSDIRPPQPASPRTAFAELNDYLTANGEAFTKKHLKWIQEQIEKTPTQEKARAMLGYARKVVFQGSDELSTDHSSRPPAPRAGRRATPVEEPSF